MIKRKIILKRFTYILLILLIFLNITAFAYDGQEVTVMINESVVSSEVPPMLVNGRTMLPLRAILNALGVSDDEIIWWELANAVEVRHNDIHIFMAVDSPEAIVNDEPVWLDSPPFVINGRTLVPVRFLSEALNFNVEWNDTTQTVYIKN